MGMPRKPENDVRLAPARFVRLEQEIDDLLEQMAARDDRPIGRVIRRVIRAGLESMGMMPGEPKQKLKRAG
jgi:hypothetical protein